MSKVSALPLAAIRSAQVRGTIEGKIERRRELEAEIDRKVGKLYEELDKISADLTALFLKHDLHTIRMPDGTSLCKTQTTRSTIVVEKLLENRVSMSVIEASTVKTTSAPFVRVTWPKKGE